MIDALLDPLITALKGGSHSGVLLTPAALVSIVPEVLLGVTLLLGRLWTARSPGRPTPTSHGTPARPTPTRLQGRVPDQVQPEERHLPGRAHFVAQAPAHQNGALQAVLVVECQSISDLHFTEDTHAERLALEFTATLRRAYPDARVTAQLSDHSFALLLPRPDPGLRRALLEPITLGGQPHYPRVRASQAEWRPDESVGTALRAAETGLGTASDANLVQISGRPAQARRTQVRLEQALRRALADGQLEVHYQPVVRLDTGELVKAEALVRWHDAEFGHVPPSQFVQLAEQLGQIESLTDLVIDRALHEARRASRSLDRDLRVAVNLAPCELNATNFMDRVARLIRAHPDAPRRLAFEVTERGALTDLARTSRTLGTLRHWGFGLALDDFGTGHSSLNLLRHLPVHHLKLDHSFLWGIEHNGQLRVVTSAVMDLASRLNVEVVAESIETPGHAAILKAMGCPLGQGYLYSRPEAKPDWAAFRPAPPKFTSTGGNHLS